LAAWKKQTNVYQNHICTLITKHCLVPSHALTYKTNKQTCFNKFGGSDDMIAKIILTTESHNQLTLPSAEGFVTADFLL
jgi:hypothetical protein